MKCDFRYANPVTIGLMAAMAIHAFPKVRATSQQKAITSNLRMLASAAQRKLLEEGAMSVPELHEDFITRNIETKPGII